MSSLVFIAGFITAAIPACFLGINNGVTLAGVVVMGFASWRTLRGAR